MFVYEVQSHEYAEFTHHVLLHDEKFSEEEFLKIVEIAREHVKPDEDDFEAYVNSKYPEDVIDALVEEFDFVVSKHPVIHVGYDFDSSCNIKKESI